GKTSIEICYNRASSMKVFLFLGLLTVTMCVPMTAFAQYPDAYLLASDFSAENKVVELDVPAQLDGAPFYIVWNFENKQNAVIFRARGGTHCYELRPQRTWQGQISVLAITLPGVSGRVKEPG